MGRNRETSHGEKKKRKARNAHMKSTKFKKTLELKYKKAKGNVVKLPPIIKSTQQINDLMQDIGNWHDASPIVSHDQDSVPAHYRVPPLENT